MEKKENISADHTVLDVISTHPETEEVFKSYDASIGECLCCQSLFDTVQQVTEKYGLDLAEMLKKLNSAAID